MAKIKIDFETRSEVDLVKCGAHAYFHGKKADIVFLTYRVDDGPYKQWFPHEDPLPWMKSPASHKFYAFNAIFEYRAWNILGVKKYGWGDLPLENLIDVQALCARFTYPQSLEMAGEVLELNVQKDKRGKYLIKKICTPPFDYTHTEFHEFMQYGMDDVRSMDEMIDALPASALSTKEQRIWEMTQRINLRGLPIDLESVTQILKVTTAYKHEQNTLLPDLTNHNVTKATQNVRIVRWIRRQGIKIPDLKAGTVEKMLDRLDLPDNVRTVLELRQELGRSSTAKYQKLIDQVYQGRLYDNLKYYGAEKTGRWGGHGFQLHNLPRSKVKDAQPIIDKFFDLSIIEDNPIAAAKSIIRGMIMAKLHKMILASDYSSIENRILAWVANDMETIRLFLEGLDQYIDMAAFMYNMPYGDVNDDQRQFGKMLILGCGYGLGGDGFQQNAADWGVHLTNKESHDAVDMYRERYKKNVKFWYNCKDAAINAICYPGKEFKVHLVSFKTLLDRNRTFWLRITLPSGRALYYNKPMVREGKFGPEPSAMGINPYSKKWQRLSMIPGRIVENIVQATARDVLADGKLALDERGCNLIGSVHDEVIMETSNTTNTFLEYVNNIICQNSPWAEGLPLKAEGMIEKRYRKM